MRRPDLDKTLLPRPHATALLPLGALAAGFGFALGGAQAQTPAAPAAPASAASAPPAAAVNEATLAPIKVRAQAEAAGASARASASRNCATSRSRSPW
jgi:catecholate siderophore receptor